MLVSVLWSDISYISFKRWTKNVIAVVMAFLVVTEPEPRQALQCLFRRSIYILIPFSLLLIKYYPHYGVDYGHWSGLEMWTGVTLHKNSLGQLCIFSFFFLAWTLIRRWQGRNRAVVRYQTHVEVSILVMTTWLLMGPQHTFANSATSTAALAVGLMAFIGLLWTKKRNMLIGASTLKVIVALIIVYGTITFMLGGLPIFKLASTFGRSETLTGRTVVWSDLMPAMMQHPILGSGFGGFWSTKTREFYDISDSHNGYLAMLLELGFVGFLILAGFLLSFCRNAQNELAHDFDWGNLCFCCLVMVLIHNIGESSIKGFSNQLMAILIFLSISMSMNRDLPQHGMIEKLKLVTNWIANNSRKF